MACRRGRSRCARLLRPRVDRLGKRAEDDVDVSITARPAQGEDEIVERCPHCGSMNIRWRPRHSVYLCLDCDQEFAAPPAQSLAQTGRSPAFERLPHAVAAARAEVDTLQASPTVRRKALYFTVYQLLRSSTFPLLGQYLTGTPPPAAAAGAQASLNRAIAALRCPHFSDWISLARTLRKHGPALGLDALPQYAAALDAADAMLIDVLPEYAHDMGTRDIKVLDAFRGLRNGSDHAGLSSPASCLRAVAHYRGWLDRLLDCFAFIGDCEFLVLRGDLSAPEPLVQCMRGVSPPAPQAMAMDAELRRTFEISQVVVRVAGGRVIPVFPLLHGNLHGEPIAGYDGHDARPGVGGSSGRAIYYLGNGDRIPVSSGEEVGRLENLLQAREVKLELSRADVRPWSIAETLRDYSTRVLEDLRGVKYVQECFVDRPHLSEPLRHFLMASTDKSKARGLVLSGAAGSGKTSLVCHLANELLAHPKQPIVLLLRGDSILPRGKGNLLFQDVAHKAGLRAKDFGGFRELLGHLAKSRSSDRDHQDRRLILVVDAVNEAPYAEQVFAEAMELIRDARDFPWVRVVVTLRDEFLRLCAQRRGDGERDPLEGMGELLVRPARQDEDKRGRQPAPLWLVPPLTLAESRAVYERYREAGVHGAVNTGARGRWDDLTPDQQRLLANPLFIRLWLVAFAEREPGPMAAASDLMEAYLDETCSRNALLWPALRRIADRMLERGRADLDDDDATALRAAWEHEQGLDPAERRFRLSPVEVACAEGLVQKRITADGGGYFVPLQLLAERILYRRLREIDAAPSAARLATWAEATRFPVMVEALSLVAEQAWKEGRGEVLAGLVPHEGGRQSLAQGVARAASSGLAANEHGVAAAQLLKHCSVRDRVAACLALVDAVSWLDAIAPMPVRAAIAGAAVEALRGAKLDRAGSSVLARALLAWAAASVEAGGGGARADALAQAVRAARRAARRLPWQLLAARLCQQAADGAASQLLRDALASLANELAQASEWTAAARALREGRAWSARGSTERLWFELRLVELHREAGDQRSAARRLTTALRALHQLADAARLPGEQPSTLPELSRSLSWAIELADAVEYRPAGFWDELWTAAPHIVKRVALRDLVGVVEQLSAFDPEEPEEKFRLAQSLDLLLDTLQSHEHTFEIIGLKMPDVTRIRERTSDLLGRLHQANPWHKQIALANAQLLLGRDDDACKRQGAAILEKLHQADPLDPDVGGALADALRLATWLDESGREQARKRALQVLEYLSQVHPADDNVALRLLGALAGEPGSAARFVALAQDCFPPTRQARRSCRYLEVLCETSFAGASPSEQPLICELAVGYAERGGLLLSLWQERQAKSAASFCQQP